MHTLLERGLSTEHSRGWDPIVPNPAQIRPAQPEFSQKKRQHEAAHTVRQNRAKTSLNYRCGRPTGPPKKESLPPNRAKTVEFARRHRLWDILITVYTVHVASPTHIGQVIAAKPSGMPGRPGADRTDGYADSGRLVGTDAMQFRPLVMGFRLSWLY